MDTEGEAEGGKEGAGHESSAESILSFGYCPTFLLSLFAHRTAAAADSSKARVA